MSTTTAGAAPALEHLGFEVCRDGIITVHVKQRSDMFGLTLERALRRIDEFKAPDQARILRALPGYYDIPAGDAPSYGHSVRDLIQSLADAVLSRLGRESTGQVTPRRGKKSHRTLEELA
jgi:hypothetical protein